MIKRRYIVSCLTVCFLVFGYSSIAQPLEKTQKVTIDVTEGTWLNLDVSPDGKEIVFDLLGDIYRLPIQGGEAISITSGTSWDMQPRFSPDGTRIAFTSDRGGANNIWTMKIDGSNPSQISNETFRLVNNPSWTADGRYIAARKHFTTSRSLGAGEIWFYHEQGGVGFPVIERANKDHQKELGEPAFSQDGKYLYFSQDTTPGSVFKYAQDSNAEIFQIFRYNLKKRETQSLISGPGGAVRPTPSPDGRYLAFVRRVRTKSALFLKDLVSGEETQVYGPIDQDLQEVWAVHGVYPNMGWLPDSTQVVFWSGGHIRTINIKTRETREIPFHVVDQRSVTLPVRPKVAVAPDRVTIKMIRNTQVSPNGLMVVFEAAGRLYLKHLPDGKIRPLTADPRTHFEYQPSWSPDSRRVVFVTWDDKALGEIRSIGLQGGRSRRLTNTPGHYRHPNFSPDRKRIVFQRVSGGFLTSPAWSVDPGIYEMPAGGGKQKLVTKRGKYPHFGAQNNRIFLTRSGETTFNLVSVNLSGGDEIVHLSSETTSQYWVSPDERYVAFRESFHVYALPLPPTGKPLVVSSKSTNVPTVKMTTDGGDYPHWSLDGKYLNWTSGPVLFRSSIDGVVRRVTENVGKSRERPLPEEVTLSLNLPADKPVSKIALVDARIVTMSDSERPVIERGCIVLDENRITALGECNTIRIPGDASVIQLQGRTIIPGLIDAHAHVPQGSEITPEQNWANYATLALGVTTIHDPGNVSAEIFPAAEMQRLGRILAPRIYSAGNVIYGAKSVDLFTSIDSAKSAHEHVRRLKSQGAHSIKNYNQPRRDQRQHIAVAAREAEMLLVAEGASLIDLDLSLVSDGNAGIEHNLPQSKLYADVIQFWSQTNVSYTPTLVVSFGGLSAEQYWYQESDVWRHPLLSHFVPPRVLQARAVRRQMAPDSNYHYLQSAKMAKLLADNHVTVNIGGHGQREGLASHWEMWSLVQGGMTPMQALRAATINPATHLGLDADIGSLAAGKLADLVVLRNNPLDDIRNSDQVELIILNGRVFDAASLDERISGERKTQPFYWQR